jgi:hypothetical protein
MRAFNATPLNLTTMRWAGLRRAATGPEFGIQQARIAKFGDPLLADELDPWVIVNRRQIEIDGKPKHNRCQ